MFRNVWLLTFTWTLAVVNVQGRDTEELPVNEFVVEYYVAYPNDGASGHHDHHHHTNLRRDLQTVTCRAVSPHTLSSNSCPASYPCTCTGSTETSCAYCEWDTTRGHVCQVTESTMTFVDRATGQMKSCACQYANGHVYSSCNDLMNRAQTAYPEGTTYPVPIPPHTQPPTTPSPVIYYTPPPTTTRYQPPVASSSACQAFAVQNLQSNDCSGTYACTCGTTATTCPYCEVDTTRGHYCFGAGSAMTFVAPQTSAMTTCSCEVVNGVPHEVCHQPVNNNNVGTVPPADSSTKTTTKKTKAHGGPKRRR